MKHIYLFGAILGTVVPYIFFIDHFLGHGVDLLGFIAALFANGAAAGFTADLLISSGIFWAYLVSQREPKTWLFILLNLTIGLSCALPAYLYLVASRKEQVALTESSA